jgi:hypothetical protein
MHLVRSKILSRIYGHGRGWCFSQVDFSDLGLRSTIDTVLNRAAAEGTIRRIMRGLYDYPAYSELLGTVIAPDMRQVVSAVARKHDWRIAPDEATALHLLGLDTQVPARLRYYSSGPNRSYIIGRSSVEFVHQKTQHTMIRDDFAGTVVQAIRALGPENLDDSRRKQIASIHDKEEFERVVKQTRRVTGWVHDEIMKIAALAEPSK